MRKFLVTAAAALLAALFIALPVYANDISVTIDGERVNFVGQQPVIVDGRTLIPVRGVFEHLGFEVEWFEGGDDVARGAILTRDEFRVYLPTGGVTFFLVNYRNSGNEVHYLDVPAQIIGGSTMLPIRAVVESAGYYVNWDNAIRTVQISSTPFVALAVPAGVDSGYVVIRGDRLGVELTELDLSDADITNEDIMPLRYMINLTTLNLSTSSVSDIAPLTGLTGLTNLNLSDAEITDITPLAGLTNLRYLRLGGRLWLGENQISDIAPLSGLTNLHTLYLQNNQITDIAPLAGLTNLELLFLNSNQITNITPLANLTNLTGLFLGFNQITDITPLAGLTNLDLLSLSSNQITNITSLANLTNLMLFLLEVNQITDITPLAGLTNLELLILFDNPITNWSPVAHIENVEGRP